MNNRSAFSCCWYLTAYAIFVLLRADDATGESALSPDSEPTHIDFALDKGEDLENRYYNGSVLSLAAYGGHLTSLIHYIKRGADGNSRGPYTGETPLHRACYCSNRLRGLPSDDKDVPDVFRETDPCGGRCKYENKPKRSIGYGTQSYCKRRYSTSFCCCEWYSENCPPAAQPWRDTL